MGGEYGCVEQALKGEFSKSGLGVGQGNPFEEWEFRYGGAGGVYATDVEAHHGIQPATAI